MRPVHPRSPVPLWCVLGAAHRWCSARRSEARRLEGSSTVVPTTPSAVTQLRWTGLRLGPNKGIERMASDRIHMIGIDRRSCATTLGVDPVDSARRFGDVAMKRLGVVALTLALLAMFVTGCGHVASDAKVAPSQPPAVASRAESSSVTPSGKSPALAAVPRVTGKTATGAKWRLELAGFKAKVKWAASSVRRGTVITQEPSGGTALAGATIELTVSTGTDGGRTQKSPAPAPPSSGDRAAQIAFRDHRSGISLTGQGIVTRVLSDDTSGDRHQRFILRLATGQTLLMAHNIDIAPRLPSLTSGAVVGFKGIYEWTAEGGTVHWTHRDPSGSHPGGWLEYRGSKYQ
jgi:hypothetical protein